MRSWAHSKWSSLVEKFWERSCAWCHSWSSELHVSLDGENRFFSWAPAFAQTLDHPGKTAQTLGIANLLLLLTYSSWRTTNCIVVFKFFIIFQSYHIWFSKNGNTKIWGTFVSLWVKILSVPKITKGWHLCASRNQTFTFGAERKSFLAERVRALWAFDFRLHPRELFVGNLSQSRMKTTGNLRSWRDWWWPVIT